MRAYFIICLTVLFWASATPAQWSFNWDPRHFPGCFPEGASSHLRVGHYVDDVEVEGWDVQGFWGCTVCRDCETICMGDFYGGALGRLHHLTINFSADDSMYVYLYPYNIDGPFYGNLHELFGYSTSWCYREADAVDAPAGFRLETAAPNPFNPATLIRFSLAETQEAALRVHDSGGRLVATLLDGLTARGEHQVSFRADALASGLYFYTLTAGARVETRKMILLR